MVPNGSRISCDKGVSSSPARSGQGERTPGTLEQHSKSALYRVAPGVPRVFHRLSEAGQFNPQ